MSNKANIFLVVNLGCEMLYVIDQRLWAQKVRREKAEKVLTDIAGILLEERLLNDLSDAHYLATHEHVRLLLEDIASASIMSLDTFSMNKLWELMTMILKWQINLIQPTDIHLLTKRHLNGVLRLVKEQETLQKVEQALNRFASMENDTNEKDSQLIREKLLYWLNNFHTKVSLLLRLGLQRPDGSFVTVLSNSNDEAWSTLQNLGDNIYTKHEILPNAEGKETENSDLHAEVSLLVNDILGGKKLNDSSSAANFIRFTGFAIDKPETSKRENDNLCDFQMQLYKDTSKLFDKMEDISKQDQHLTLQDELLTMLDEEAQHDEKD